MKSAEKWALNLWKKSGQAWREREQDHNYRDLIVRPALREAILGLEKITDGTFLDIGCAEGEETNYLWNLLKTSGFSGTMYGYDPQGHFIKVARKKYPPIRFVNSESLEKVIVKENLVERTDLISSLFALQETPNINQFLKNIYSGLKIGGTAVFVLVHPEFGEAMGQKNALRINSKLGSNEFWQFAAEYPIVEENDKTFYVPYFHRALNDYSKLVQSYFKKIQLQELKPNRETIEKSRKEKVSPFYNHSGNIYYPEIVEMASSLLILAEK